MIPKILCSISTRGRYDSTLSMAIQSVITQTKKPDHLVIFDDNDEPLDLRENKLYSYLFHMLYEKNITWQVIFGQKKGQHYNHQIANTMGFDWVWRIDDDTVAEPNVLENLCSYISQELGAVGGSVLTPPFIKGLQSTGRIEDIQEQSIQWDYIKEIKEVDHLHCSFLYRAGVYDYNLSLSRAAFREETLFTYGLKQKGYKILVVPDTITWHLKNSVGGVRTVNKEMFDNDDRIFRNHLLFEDQTVVVLDCGMGDHVVFKHVLPYLKNPVVFSCYPDIIPGRSIQEAKDLFGDIDCYNVYKKMIDWKWNDTLENAFRKLYGLDK
jgi:glycosyltransferase involved in cell wall biosynthesis